MQRGIGGGETYLTYLPANLGLGVKALAAVALVAAAACSDSNSTTSTPVATTITAASATNGQSGTVGATLAQPLSVAVADQSGAPLPNASVTWTVVGAGGSVASPSSTTDASGNATMTWTLGNAVGVDSVTATIGTGALVTFTATAAAGPISAMRVTSGGSQTVTAGSASAPLVVQVVDQFGNPIPNATVTWAVQGGGSLSAVSSTTDATGTTQVTLTTDPVATNYTVTATTGNLTPVAFSITAM